MKKKKNSKVKFLLVLLLVLSIGYALITTVLKINGEAKFAHQSWNVYWDNPQVTEGSKLMVKPVIEDDSSTSKKTKATWSVTFDLPGEFYEFTIDAVNAGTMDAVITSIDTTVTPELPDYISYSVTYENGGKVKEKQVLPAAVGDDPTIITYRVRIEYLLDEVDATTINDMEEDISLTYSFGITYSRMVDEPIKTEVLTPEELEEFVALVSAHPDVYRNKEQNPLNRDIGIDAYGNVINMDNFRSVPSLLTTACKPYYVGSEGAYLYGCEGHTATGLRWATASDFYDNGEWTLNIPAYIMEDGDGEFIPVTTIDTFFKGKYSDRPADETLTKMPLLPYTLKTITGDAFAGIGSLVEPVTIPETVEEFSCDAFAGAWRDDADAIIRVPSSYEGDLYNCDGITIEYYD